MDVHLNRPWFIPGTVVPIDPPVNQPPQIDLTGILGPSERELYMRRYGSIRTYQRESNLGRMSYYNYRLPVEGTIHAFRDHMRAVFNRQAVAFKLNASIGSILPNKVTGQLRYFHASANNYKLTPQPLVIQVWEDMEDLIYMTDSQEWTTHAANQMPNSTWQVVMVTNIAITVYHMQAHPIGGGHDFIDDEADDDDDDDHDDDDNDDEVDASGDNVGSDREKGNRGGKIAGVCKVPANEDNLCVFHCIDMDMDVRKFDKPKQPEKRRDRHRSASVLFRDWWESVNHGKSTVGFQGVFMQDLYLVEEKFDVGFNVYTKEGNNAIMLRRQPIKYHRTINVYMPREGHFDYIWSLEKFATSYVCRNCGQYWKRLDNLKRHEASCARASQFKYKGGPYAPRPRFYNLLEEIGICVAPEDRFYDFRATFDLEALIMPLQVEGIYVSKHVPMSVSVASNVPGLEGPYCIVSDGDPHNLVYKLIQMLCNISDEAYQHTKQRMAPYIDRLEELQQQQLRELSLMTDHERKMAKTKISPLKKATDRLETWMRSLPIISFNGSRYDLQLIKPYLAAIYAITDTNYALSGGSSNPRVLEEQSLEELGDCLSYILKKGNAVMCFATRKLIFLDVLSYVPPGYSYTKYLETYGDARDGAKSFWPYEYVDSLEKLNEKQLPPYGALYSSLKQANTLEEGKGLEHGQKQYRQLQMLWQSKEMTCLRDLLIHYNDADVLPFLKAINRQVAYTETWTWTYSRMPHHCQVWHSNMVWEDWRECFTRLVHHRQILPI